MCAINPKFKKFFRLEFYTSHGDEETFNELLAERLCWMEQAFNESGKIRVHIHDIPADEGEMNCPQCGELLSKCACEPHTHDVPEDGGTDASRNV